MFARHTCPRCAATSPVSATSVLARAPFRVINSDLCVFNSKRMFLQVGQAISELLPPELADMAELVQAVLSLYAGDLSGLKPIAMKLGDFDEDKITKVVDAVQAVMQQLQKLKSQANHAARAGSASPVFVTRQWLRAHLPLLLSDRGEAGQRRWHSDEYKEHGGDVRHLRRGRIRQPLLRRVQGTVQALPDVLHMAVRISQPHVWR